MRFYMCCNCNKTVTKIKWIRDLKNFTATPICFECYIKGKVYDKARKEKMSKYDCWNRPFFPA